MAKSCLLWLMVLLLPSIAKAEVQTWSFEEQARQQLRKLDTWGLRRLVQAEGQIDKVQK
ncbi:MAG: hypothetical protein HYW07_18425, partial [Candidatus Latescibacteria bacterium]|nr:hypothetical protein [Candidatus Latescibacterota bacterium]